MNFWELAGCQTINRTKVELKYAFNALYQFPLGSINRTKVELKLMDCRRIIVHQLPINRTKVELKWHNKN